VSAASEGRAMGGGLMHVLEIGLSPVLWITKKLLAIPALGWKSIGLAIVSGSFGVTLWARVHSTHHTLDGTTWSGKGSLALWSGMVIIVTLGTVALVGFDHLGVATLHRIARALPASGRGAFAIARHTLESRRATPMTLTSGPKLGGEFPGLVYMAFLTSLFVANLTIDHAVARQADALAFDAVVVPAGTPAAGAASSLGVDRSVLDASVIAALAADPHLAVVPYGQVTVGATDGSATTSSITLVSARDLNRLVAGGARPLGLQDGVVLSSSVEDGFPARTGLIDVATGADAATVFHRHWFGATTLATRSWGEATWGEVPIVGALVTFVGADEPAGGRLDYIVAVAASAGATAHAAPRLSAADVAYHLYETGYTFSAFGWMAIFMAVLATLATIWLAVGTVRAHRRVRATVAALGATPRALALAVPIDAGITLAVAFAIGAPLGGIASAFAKHPTLFTDGAPLDPVATVWGLAWNLTHIAWMPLAGFAAAAWALAVIVSGIYGLTVARRTPVDELREAIKEGAL